MATKSRAGVGGGKYYIATEGAVQTLADARVTRSGEKRELVVLNDRFASYIEKVRSLQERNTKLTTQIRIQEASRSEETNITEVYETELTELRALVDQLTQETTQQEAERASWQAQAEEWQAK